jgi:hypothetical protein
MKNLPITVSSRSKAWNVFARSNAGIVGSNPTRDMDVCLRLFCVCVCSDLAKGWFSVQGVLPTVLWLRNRSETKRFTDALCSKGRASGKRERERVNAEFERCEICSTYRTGENMYRNLVWIPEEKRQLGLLVFSLQINITYLWFI